MRIIEALRAAAGTIRKRNTLQNLKTEEFEKVCFYAYNPYYVYNMKMQLIRDNIIGEPSNEMFSLLNEIVIKAPNITKLDKAKVHEFAKNNGNLILLIVNKDLKIGMNIKSLNAVLDKKIPSFDVQLAKEAPINLEKKYVLEPKYDGVRCIILHNVECGTRAVTRNGRIIHISNLDNIFKDVAENCMLDGELVIENGKLRDRVKVSGIVNSAIKSTHMKLEAGEVVLRVFDGMPLDQFESHHCSMQYNERIDYVDRIILGLECILSTPKYDVIGEEVLGLFNSYVQEGYEGVIVKEIGHLYSFKRSKDWIKLKEIKDVDLICIDYIKGAPDTKYKYSIGALKCKGVVEGKEVVVNVGSGLTDEQRKLKNATTYVGSTIEVKYNAVIQDSKTKKYSLFLPRFVCVREDK